MRLIWFGISAIILPFLLMALEYIWALLSGATGEHLAAAGFWGVALGYFLIPIGMLLLVVGLLGWLLRR